MLNVKMWQGFPEYPSSSFPTCTNLHIESSENFQIVVLKIHTIQVLVYVQNPTLGEERGEIHPKRGSLSSISGRKGNNLIAAWKFHPGVETLIINHFLDIFLQITCISIHSVCIRQNKEQYAI